MNFKISSALKNLIGRELITDKYVAIFELVKNAYDAGASEAKITFLADKNGVCNKIIIADDGCGMDLKDLQEKWLFVGYSEKTQHTSRHDYRSQIGKQRNMAGAKGVGRFSCDRLGQKLRLVSAKQSNISHELLIDWGNFEKNSLEEFSKVPISYSKISTNETTIREHGTYLEVSELRDVWDRTSLIALKSHLMKLINPVSSNDDNFSIVINAEHEKSRDILEKYEHRKINGYVHNFVFEKLGLKTTGISVKISPDGKTISTKLIDRGKLIYELLERNSNHSLLSNISVYIYQLNTAAKKGFASVMGTSPLTFGSIFVYKNGFRIYPYGEPGDDSLKIDQRKQQGYNRYFGTREIIGRIEIDGEQNELRETTSRSGGIVKNDTYEQLCSFFTDFCLKRLERYAVDVVKWGELNLNAESLSSEEKLEVGKNILRVISNLANSNDVINVNYAEDVLSILHQAQSESSSRLPDDLLDLAKTATDKAAARKIRAAASNIKALAKARKQAEKTAEKLAKTNDLMKSEIQQKEKQVLFLTKTANPNIENILEYCHSIITYADAISGWIRTFNQSRENGELFWKIQEQAMRGIADANSRISMLTRFITRANFNAASNAVQGDIVQFICEYCKNFLSEIHSSHIKIDCASPSISFEMEYSPLELGLALENLVSNSLKSESSYIRFSFESHDKGMLLIVSDNGNGLSKNILDKDCIFQKGYSTTSGSGLGLYQLAKYIKKVGGSIEIAKNTSRGFTLKIFFNKK